MRTCTKAGPARARLRVLYIIDTLRRGGKERQAVEMMKELKRGEQVEFVVVCMDKENEFEVETTTLGIPIHYVVRSFRWDPWVFGRLYKIVHSLRPHIVHTFCAMTTFYVLPVCRLLGVKLINGSIRSAFREGTFRRLFGKWLFYASDAIIANSCAGLASRGLCADEKKFFVVHNGFDFSRVDSIATNTPCVAGVPEGKKVVGMVASFSDYKDYNTYLLAGQDVLSRRNDVVFVAVGSGKNLDTCRKMIANHLHSIRLLGKRTDVEKIVATFDVGVLSTFSEGISNSVMEYMALAKPVVLTDGGGSKEIVADGKTGFLVPSENPLFLAEKIEFLLDHPETARQMGEAGRERLQQSFSVAAMVKRLLQIYHTALNGVTLS
jgi:glycosyltransferase involved in cell wall biosynthesis